MNELYSLRNISKTYAQGEEFLTVLSNINLHVTQGDTLAVVGTSGSGKSTLLQLMGTLDTPSAGAIFFQGTDISRLSWQERARIRNRHIGFVFQFHHLLPEFTAKENVAMPALIAGMPRQKAFKKAERALENVGLAQRMSHRVTTLSGGERQRAAIARALLLEPEVLLADEPTGNLDEKTGQDINQLLLKLNSTLNITLVIVTHNPGLARSLQRAIELRSGELYES